MTKIPYTKPALSYQEQLDQLINRGLLVDNKPKALHLLKYISYYRLSGYWYPMLKNPKSDHVFKEGSSFENAFNFYCFDSKLRKLVLSELEKIEVSIRAKMIYLLSHKHGPFWFSESDLFKNSEELDQSLDNLKKEKDRSRDNFINHFNEKYSDEYPPSWVIFEVSSFGILSRLYKNLKEIPEKKKFADCFGIRSKIMESWLHHIVYVRNVCAHHSRFWNRTFSINPKLPKETSNIWLKEDIIDSIKINKKSYFTLSMIVYLLNTINPNHNFIEKFCMLLDKYPIVSTKDMGFTEDWKSEELWNP